MVTALPPTTSSYIDDLHAGLGELATDPLFVESDRCFRDLDVVQEAQVPRKRMLEANEALFSTDRQPPLAVEKEEAGNAHASRVQDAATLVNVPRRRVWKKMGKYRAREA